MGKELTLRLLSDCDHVMACAGDVHAQPDPPIHAEEKSSLHAHAQNFEGILPADFSKLKLIFKIIMKTGILFL